MNYMNKNKKKDLYKVETYNKLLSRIHLKIKTISRQRNNNQWCWYFNARSINWCT